MTDLEAAGIVVIAVAIAAIATWLFLPRIWPRLRRRWWWEREQEPVTIADVAATQQEINRIREKQRRIMEEVVVPTERQAEKLFGLFGVHADQRFTPGAVVVVTGDPREVIIASTSTTTDDDWIAVDPPTWEFPEKWVPADG